MMRFTAADWELVVGPGPLRFHQRVAGELVEGLANELGASPAEVDPLALATTLGDRADTAIGLDLAGAGESFAIRA